MEHVPAGALHTSQGLLQALLQQKPSAQKPEVQWSSSVQGEPFPDFPTQLPLAQCRPGAQSRSLAQTVGQPVALPLHTKAPQLGTPALPDCAGVHTPGVRSQTSHALLQAVSQQKPLAQWFE